MDQELIVYLTDEQKESAREAEALFGSKGWGTVLDYLKSRALIEKERALRARSWDDNRLSTGAMIAFEELQSLPQAIENELTALAMQAKEAVSLDTESRYE